MLSADAGSGGSGESVSGNGNTDSAQTPGTGDTYSGGEAAGDAGSSNEGFDPSSLFGLFGSGGIDLNMIMGLGKVLSAAGSDDKNTALLMALKPHLSSQRQGKVDKAVRLLKMYSMFIALKDSGMLGQMI